MFVLHSVKCLLGRCCDDALRQIACKDLPILLVSYYRAVASAAPLSHCHHQRIKAHRPTPCHLSFCAETESWLVYMPAGIPKCMSTAENLCEQPCDRALPSTHLLVSATMTSSFVERRHQIYITSRSAQHKKVHIITCFVERVD